MSNENSYVIFVDIFVKIFTLFVFLLDIFAKKYIYVIFSSFMSNGFLNYVISHFPPCQNHIFLLHVTVIVKRNKCLSNKIQNYANADIIMSLRSNFALTLLLINLPSHNLLPPHIQLQLIVGISTKIAQHVLKGLPNA